jgi:hypothetical protein
MPGSGKRRSSGKKRERNRDLQQQHMHIASSSTSTTRDTKEGAETQAQPERKSGYQVAHRLQCSSNAHSRLSWCTHAFTTSIPVISAH